MSDSPLAVTRKDKKERETITKVSAGAVIIQRDNIRNRFQQSQEERRLQYAELHKIEDQSKLDMVATLFERKHATLLNSLKKVGKVKMKGKPKKHNQDDDLEKDILAFFTKFLVKIYLKMLKSARKNMIITIEDINSTVKTLLTVKKLTSFDLDEEERLVVGKFLQDLGFYGLSSHISLSRKGDELQGKKRSFARFQLQVTSACCLNNSYLQELVNALFLPQHMGQHLSQNSDPEIDSRVNKFCPDPWQVSKLHW